MNATTSAYTNITAAELKKIHKFLATQPQSKGLNRFVVQGALMESNPNWFADELLHALCLHFGLLKTVK